MTTKLFYPAGLDVLGTYFSQVTDQESKTNFDDLTEFSSGDYAPSYTGVRQHDPVFNVDTLDIYGVVSLVDKSDLAKSCTSGDVKMFFRQAEANAIRYGEATSNHTVYTATSNAMFFWDQIKANQGREAAISVQVHTTYNGSNDPLTLTAGTTITVSPVISSMFTLGPVSVNGTTLAGVQSMTWSNNVRVDKIAADGDGTITFVCIKSFRPVVTIETLDIHALASYAVEGTALTALNVYLRKRKRAVVNYADADTEHIKLAATKGSFRVSRTSGDQATGVLEIALERPAAETDVFAITTGTAIT